MAKFFKGINMNIRQSILLRTDLNLPKGLAEAQVAHIHFEIFRKTILHNISPSLYKGELIISPEVLSWLNTPYTYVHGVPNIEVLNKFIKDTKDKGLINAEWRDTIYVRISDTQEIVVEDCLVGFAILGESDKIRAVIGDLPLLG